MSTPKNLQPYVNVLHDHLRSVARNLGIPVALPLRDGEEDPAGAPRHLEPATEHPDNPLDG